MENDASDIEKNFRNCIRKNNFIKYEGSKYSVVRISVRNH
jgi:hypothetical protein